MITQYRVGNVEGPFLPTTQWIDGSRKCSRKQAGYVKYWVVRYMDGNILSDRRFASAESADAFWLSLPVMAKQEYFQHDDCPECGTPSVPLEGIPDQFLRVCPKCQREWFENLDDAPGKAGA